MRLSSIIGYPRTPRGAFRMPGIAAVLACVALLAVGGGIAQASTGSIEGTVTNHTAKGVEGIEVSVVNEQGTQLGSTTTASNGKYTIAGIAEDEYTVVFSDKTEVYLTKSAAQFIEEGKAAKLNVVLTKAGSFAGVVTSAATNEGLADVSVEIDGPAGAEELFHGIFTDAHGHYALKHLAPGRYELEFSAEGSDLSQRVSVELAEGEEHLYNVALTEGGKISGTVTDAYSHAALEKIGVYAYIPDHGGGFAVTNAKGEYTVTGLSSGAYDVEYYWIYSEAEEKEYEKAPAEIPKYITQYFNNQIGGERQHGVRQRRRHDLRCQRGDGSLRSAQRGGAGDRGHSAGRRCAHLLERLMDGRRHALGADRVAAEHPVRLPVAA